MNKWVVIPVKIGEVTRYRVAREDLSESRGFWDRHKDAVNLAFRLNAEDWDKEAFEDDEIDEF